MPAPLPLALHFLQILLCNTVTHARDVLDDAKVTAQPILKADSYEELADISGEM